MIKMLHEGWLDSSLSSFTRNGGKFSSIKLTDIILLEKNALNVSSWGLLDSLLSMKLNICSGCVVKRLDFCCNQHVLLTEE